MSQNGLGGHMEVKLIHNDRKSSTWNGWRRKWVDFLRVKEEHDDSELPKRTPDNEIWLNVRNHKHSPMPVIMWTLTAKRTCIYRVPSKSRFYAFAIASHGKPVVYGCGASETDAQAWMAAIRNKLVPPKIAANQAFEQGLFEASVIDTNYTNAADLQGAYGFLAVQPDRLTLLHARDLCVTQEWYLKTTHRFYVRDTPLAADKGKILVIQCDKESPTGEGDMVFFVPNAHRLLGLLHDVLLGRIRGTSAASDVTDGSEPTVIDNVDVKSLLAIRPEKSIIEAAEIVIANSSKVTQDGSQESVYASINKSSKQQTEQSDLTGSENEDEGTATRSETGQSDNNPAQATPNQNCPPQKPPRKSMFVETERAALADNESTTQDNASEQQTAMSEPKEAECGDRTAEAADQNQENVKKEEKVLQGQPEEEPHDIVEHIRSSRALDERELEVLKFLETEGKAAEPLVTPTMTDEEVEAILSLPEPTVEDILSTIDAAVEETEKALGPETVVSAAGITITVDSASKEDVTEDQELSPEISEQIPEETTTTKVQTEHQHVDPENDEKGSQEMTTTNVQTQDQQVNRKNNEQFPKETTTEVKPEITNEQQEANTATETDNKEAAS